MTPRRDFGARYLWPAMIALIVGVSSHQAALAKRQPTILSTPLDIAIPVFDPGIPEDQDSWDKKGIFPELRRAEARHMAVRLADTLSETGRWDAVRVVPTPDAISDIVIYASIIESTGSKVELAVLSVDARGKRLLKKSYKHKISKYYYENPRAGEVSEPYQPLYDQIAADLFAKAIRIKAKDISEIETVRQIRYGQQFAPAAFEGALSKSKKSGRYKLLRKPAEDDPMMQRVAMINLRDQMFGEAVHQTFEAFAENIDQDYIQWRQQYSLQYEAQKKAKRSANSRMIFGALLAVGGAVAGAKSDSAAGNIASASAVIGGAALGFSGYSKLQESKAHKTILEEIGRTINSNLASQVIEIEGRTATLTGTIEEQSEQWRRLLAEVYFSETGNE